jgi:spore coat protein CotH
MKLIFTLLTCSIFTFMASGQNLPFEKRLSEDGHFLTTGGNVYTGLYDESAIQEIRIYFKESDYWTILKNNYNSKTNLLANIKYNDKAMDSIGIRFKGQTSYQGGPGGGSSINSPKKSFDIELDYIKSGQSINGYNTLNLNNSFEDASFMREVFYYHNIRRHTPAAKANFVHLYLNDEDWGIYQNVQQENKDFLKEWWPSNDGSNWRADVDGAVFGGGGGSPWGNGTTALNYLGEDSTKYKQYYTLKSDDLGNPWQALMDACQLLNTAPIADLHTVLDQYFDMDKILWHLASEILFSDDDSYVYKGRMDYFLYRDAETGRFTTYDYDGNSSMETKFVNWSPFYNETKVNYPLLNRVLANPAYRQRYIAHMKTLLNDYCDETKVNETINQFAALIDAAVNADPKKQTTYAAFKSDVEVLKKFMKDRKAFILSNAEFKNESPVIADMAFTSSNKWVAPKSDENALVEVSASHPNGIYVVNLYYGLDLFGRFNPAIVLVDNGSNGDKTANDNIYSGYIPGQAAQTWIRFYTEVVANNTAKTVAYSPAGAEHDVMLYQVQATQSQANDVVINEFMATNENGPKDEKGSSADWIELFNKSNNQIDLSGYYLSDNSANLKKWQVPAGVKIAANGYLIFWADEDQMQGPTHTSFKLSSTGETISLSDKSGALLDSYTYSNATKDKSFARIPNGTGNFAETANYTFNSMNNANTVTEQVTKIVIVPNPASNSITLYGASDNIKIYTITGTQVYSTSVASGEQIDVSTLPRGMYIIIGEKIKPVKIILE